MRPIEAVQAAAEHYGVDADWILSTRRTAKVTLARQHAAYTLAADGWSCGEIGTALGRDHTTIIHALRRIRKMDLKPLKVRRAGAPSEREEELAGLLEGAMETIQRLEEALGRRKARRAVFAAAATGSIH